MLVCGVCAFGTHALFAYLNQNRVRGFAPHTLLMY